MFALVIIRPSSYASAARTSSEKRIRVNSTTKAGHSPWQIFDCAHKIIVCLYFAGISDSMRIFYLSEEFIDGSTVFITGNQHDLLKIRLDLPIRRGGGTTGPDVDRGHFDLQPALLLLPAADRGLWLRRRNHRLWGFQKAAAGTGAWFCCESQVSDMAICRICFRNWCCVECI